MSDKRRSALNVKKEFTFLGLVLIVYTLIINYLPDVLYVYFKDTDSIVMHNEILFFGIFYIVVLFSVIPFILLLKQGNLKLNKIFRHINASFKDLIVQAIVFFTLSTLIIYLSSAIFIRFGFGSRLMSNIGNILHTDYLNNRLYAFMFIFLCPFIEEFIFRGILLSYLSRYGKRFGMFFSALFYALAHKYFLDMIPAYVMGILLAKATFRYKSIQTPIVIHILFNSFIYFLCVAPANVTRYMSYILLAIYIIAFILMATRTYSIISVPRSINRGIVEKILFSRLTIIIAILLMIINSFLFRFVL